MKINPADTIYAAINPQEDVNMKATGIVRRIDDLGERGGYLLAPVHNIQPDVPPENIIAMYQTGLEYGRYHN